MTQTVLNNVLMEHAPTGTAMMDASPVPDMLVSRQPGYRLSPLTTVSPEPSFSSSTTSSSPCSSHSSSPSSSPPSPSQSSPSEPAEDGSIRIVSGSGFRYVTPFPWTLHQLLCDVSAPDVVSWLDGGRSFRVHDPQRFIDEVAPAYFQCKSYKSFQRQLHLYGFRRVTSGECRGAYFHPKFIRSDRRLTHQMPRIKAPSSSKSKSKRSSVKKSKETTDAPRPTRRSARQQKKAPKKIIDDGSYDGDDEEYLPEVPSSNSQGISVPNFVSSKPMNEPVRADYAGSTFAAPTPSADFRTNAGRMSTVSDTSVTFESTSPNTKHFRLDGNPTNNYECDLSSPIPQNFPIAPIEASANDQNAGSPPSSGSIDLNDDDDASALLLWSREPDAFSANQTINNLDAAAAASGDLFASSVDGVPLDDDDVVLSEIPSEIGYFSSRASPLTCCGPENDDVGVNLLEHLSENDLDLLDAISFGPDSVQLG